MGLTTAGKSFVFNALAGGIARMYVEGTGINLFKSDVSMSDVADQDKGRILELQAPVQFDIDAGSAGRSITEIKLSNSAGGTLYTIDVTAQGYTFEEVGGRLTVSELEVFVDE